MRYFAKDYNLVIKRCYRIVWNEKKTDSKNAKVARTNIGKLMILLKCALCDTKKPRFIKEQKVSRLFSSLRIK